MRRCLPALVFVFVVPCNAAAQRPVQLWGNLTFDWVKSDRVTYEIDFEPKTLAVVPEGQPGWGNLDMTPNLTLTANDWLDVTGELVAGYTQQTDAVHSFELTPRVGVTFHFLSRELPPLSKRERAPKRRFVLYNDLRVEWRNFYYNGDQPNSSTVRFRNRLGSRYPINRDKVTDDGAAFLEADWEWFIPLSDAAERFANRQRIRVGLGYRQNFNWRYEVMFMWTRSRDTIEENFAATESIIDFRLRYVF